VWHHTLSVVCAYNERAKYDYTSKEICPRRKEVFEDSRGAEFAGPEIEALKKKNSSEYIQEAQLLL